MSPSEPLPAASLLVTQELLHRAKDGDARALDALMSRYGARLSRWASGRLPSFARSLCDTNDLVQETLLRTIQRLDQLDVGDAGTFQAYVRQAVLNRIKDQVRWAVRRPGPGEVPEEIEARTPSPLEQAIGNDVLERFETAMEQLPEAQRQLVHLRIDLDYTYEEIAAMTNRPSVDAVRMAVQRAVQRLAELMRHER